MYAPVSRHGVQARRFRDFEPTLPARIAAFAHYLQIRPSAVAISFGGDIMNGEEHNPKLLGRSAAQTASPSPDIDPALMLVLGNSP